MERQPTGQPPKASATQPSLPAVHGLGPTAVLVRATSELGFPRRSIAQRRRPIKERGHLLELRCQRSPTSQTSPSNPLSTYARMSMADSAFGAALTTLADSALSPSSFHHSGLATSAHSSRISLSKAFAVATVQPSEPIG
eukprot:scaffold77290_cov58-Phaeocystis_antarctica.AAC.4